MTSLQIRQALEQGRQVRTKLHGNSMTPKIDSGDVVVIEPWPADRILKKGDIVFCKVSGNYYLHLVTALRDGQVQIGNNHGRINGWTKRENVFGRFVGRSGR